MSLPLQSRPLLNDEMIGKCCGYVRCKEQNTNFNCMTEADCLGYTNQGYVRSKQGPPITPSPLVLVSEGDQNILRESQWCLSPREPVLHTYPRVYTLS